MVLNPDMIKMHPDLYQKKMVNNTEEFTNKFNNLFFFEKEKEEKIDKKTIEEKLDYLIYNLIPQSTLIVTGNKAVEEYQKIIGDNKCF